MSLPQISVIVPGYRSERTVAACLQALRRQTFPGFEVILVDSSPDDATVRIVTDGFPEVRCIRSPVRLLPHAARNLGAAWARAQLYAFTDPDIYPEPDWLERLLDRYRRCGGPVVGSMISATRDWLSVGAHLAKFDQWLPGPEGRQVSVGLTGNFLCPRGLFDALGGFRSELMLGDAEFSHRLLKSGSVLTFEPRARVNHHHLTTFASLLRERRERGREFGALRRHWQYGSGGPGRALALLTILPLRWLKLMARTGRYAREAGWSWDYWRTWPVVAGAWAAWLLGEGQAYAGIFRPVTKARP